MAKTNSRRRVRNQVEKVGRASKNTSAVVIFKGNMRPRRKPLVDQLYKPTKKKMGKCTTLRFK